MEKCLFIIPYFGKFSNYFPFFLKSCEANSDFRWLIITDNTVAYRYPENVSVIHRGFTWMQEKVKEKFDFPVVLDHPYKLCDYKPAYGYIFEEYVRGYPYWGYCDCDLVFGNLNRLLSPLLDENYDKLFAAGHMTIYRNTEDNNRRFLHPYKGRKIYRMAFTTSEIRWFDEDYHGESIHNIFLEDGTKIFTKDMSFNISVSHSQFYRTRYVNEALRFQKLPFCRALYVWKKGELEQTFLSENNEMITETFLYLHFQQRHMRFRRNVENKEIIQIYPNGFRALRRYPVTLGEWRRLTRYSFNLHYFRRKYGNLKKKIETQKRNELRR